MFFSLETKSFAWFSRSPIKVSKNKTNFDFLTTFTSYNKIIKSLDIMEQCLYQLYVFWPCWSSNKGNIQIIIIRDVVPWLTSYWCTFQWRIKLSDDIWKCMEWTTISITLTFQYNFCFGIVLAWWRRGSQSTKVCVVWTYMSWRSYHEKPRVQCTYYLHGKTGNSGWKIKWSASFHLPWVPEDIFFLSTLMVRGEATSTRRKAPRRK